MVLSRSCKGFVALIAGAWLASVATVREMRPLVSAIRKGSFVVTIEIVVVALGEVSRSSHAECLTKGGKAEECLARAHRLLLLNACFEQVTDNFSFGFVLLLGKHMNVLV